jgi:hypothetical protein
MGMETVIFALSLVAALTISFSTISANAQQTASVGTAVSFERTAMSSVDALIGHQAHQAVVVLPPRTDGKLWVGTISWTASKPVELRLLYDYNSGLTTDAIHGKPVTAPLAVTTEMPHIPIGEVAISLIKPFNGPATVSSSDSGSMSFVAKAVAFHTINGTRFTVTYAVDATPKQMTQ